MPRVSYDAPTRDAITKAAVEARDAGKTWRDAHEAAFVTGDMHHRVHRQQIEGGALHIGCRQERG